MKLPRLPRPTPTQRGANALHRKALLALFAAVFAVIWLTPGRAQDPRQAFDQAQAVFDSGDYRKAAEEFEAFAKNYPTSAEIFAAKLRLAYALFFSQQLDKAAEVTKTLLVPPTTPDVIERAAALLPQITTAKAAQAERGSGPWKNLLEQANKEYTEFITKYPRSTEAELAVYSRALNSLQLQKFDDAIKDLRANLEAFPNSPTIFDSKYLLALTLSSKAAAEIAKVASVRENPEPLYNEAERILRALISERANLAVANDASFQLGDVLIARSALAAEAGDTAQRDRLLEEALVTLRSVQAKEPLIAAQEERIAKLREELTAALRAVNRPAADRLRESIQLESKRLAGLKTRPDQKLAAMLKIGEVLYRRNDWNGLRALMNFLKPFATGAEEMKMALYYTAVSYAGQMERQKAEAAYAAFKERFKGDPVAMNLPLLMSNMYLASQPVDANRAIELLQEAQTDYPDSPFADQTALQEAQALLSLGRFEEALNRFQRLLDKKPAQETAIAASLGMAQASESLGKLDDAIAIYKQIRENNPGSKPAEISHFQIASLSARKNDHATALAEFDSFLSAYPESDLVPNALFFKGQSLQALNRPEEALAVYKELPERFKDSPFSPYAFFQRASILQMQGRNDEMITALREFIQTYPDFQDEPGKTLFFNAHDIIASTLSAAGKPAEAIETYEQFVSLRKDDPNAAAALLKISALSRQSAESMGRYLALNEAERPAWNERINKAREAAERVLADYPSSPSVAGALQALLGLQRLFLSAEIIKAEAIPQYFEGLAAKHAENADLKNKILFTLASYVAETDPARALEIRKSAYNESLLYAPADLEGFGLALLENGEIDEAEKVFDKLASDYPVPAGVEPASAGPDIVRAQAAALFGKGMVFKKRGDEALAMQNFTQLKELYPFSDKVLEANIALAEGLFEAGKNDEALKLLAPVIQQSAAPPALRSKALLLGGQIHAKNGNDAVAVDFLSKCAGFFPDEKANASAALLLAGEISEQIASREADPKKKEAALLTARRSYNDIVTKYPDSAAAPKANQRLAALGGPPPAR